MAMVVAWLDKSSETRCALGDSAGRPARKNTLFVLLVPNSIAAGRGWTDMPCSGLSVREGEDILKIHGVAVGVWVERRGVCACGLERL